MIMTAATRTCITPYGGPAVKKVYRSLFWSSQTWPLQKILDLKADQCSSNFNSQMRNLHHQVTHKHTGTVSMQFLQTKPVTYFERTLSTMQSPNTGATSESKPFHSASSDSIAAVAMKTNTCESLKNIAIGLERLKLPSEASSRATSIEDDKTQEDEMSLLASRRIDPTTVRQVYYFDTLALSKKLESKGFTREQAEVCAECLLEIINTTLDHQGRHMVTKPQQEIVVQQLMSEIVCVKKDMTLLQKSEFSSLKTETQKMSIGLSQIQGQMSDEIVRLKGQFSLDINLEKGRSIEEHAENEKRIQMLHNKIDTEVANLKTLFEIYRNDVYKYAGGTVVAVGGIVLGIIRLWN